MDDDTLKLVAEIRAEVPLARSAVKSLIKQARFAGALLTALEELLAQLDQTAQPKEAQRHDTHTEHPERATRPLLSSAR